MHLDYFYRQNLSKEVKADTIFCYLIIFFQKRTFYENGRNRKSRGRGYEKKTEACKYEKKISGKKLNTYILFFYN